MRVDGPLMTTEKDRPHDNQGLEAGRPHTQPISGRFLTVEEVAAYLNVKVKMVYALIPQIPHYRIGRLLRFKKEEIDAWMESQRRGGAPLAAPVRRETRIRRPKDDLDAILQKAIDEVKSPGYTSLNGKSGHIKSLGKEG